MAVTVENIRVICAVPEGVSLPTMRVDTNVPDFCDLGYGAFSYRCLAMKLVMKKYLTPLLEGRNAENIEELRQL